MKLLKRARKFILPDKVEQIRDKARQARLLLHDPSFSDYQELIADSISAIENKILNNTIREVEEAGIIGSLTKTFITPKKVQLDELSGKYRILKDINATLASWMQDDDDLDRAIANEEVEVKRE